ncbi:hypothetical protein K1T71_010731 [Dendrolimus kikuchii]|uniref:Uncharacterized protein n=1 Tax=Dendrolimus kikuchii TaxID=765133 RepID=A0ACC1CPZ3_9NEOP|nr:hypothetical protein K1T71_010731 [Dendrolimus kikuchii]
MYLPNLNDNVCAKCKKALTTNEKLIVEPPDAYFKRLALVDNSNSQCNNNTDGEIAERLQKLRENQYHVPSSTEEQIAQRLQKIKSAVPSTSDAELRSRLAILKGVPDVVAQARPVLPAPDLRTEQEQADDLLKQYMEQTNIDKKYKNEFDQLVNDMESRMEKLKGVNPSNVQNTKIQENDESEDEEERIKKILEKVKTEVTLEDSEVSPPTNDELPFCEICNEDARMRCLGCRYLFCKQCFTEHKDDDDGCDRYEAYEPPKGSQY